MGNQNIPSPTESQEQQALFRWAAYQRVKYPELDLLYHIPNEGKRSISAGGRMKAEGLKSGVPDICLPVAHGGFHGMYVELKRVNGGQTSANQKSWLAALIDRGYYAIICHGWESAAHEIVRYLECGVK